MHGRQPEAERERHGRAEGNPGRVRSKDSIEERSMRSCTIVIQLCRIFGGPTRRVLLTYLLAYLLTYLITGSFLITPAIGSVP